MAAMLSIGGQFHNWLGKIQDRSLCPHVPAPNQNRTSKPPTLYLLLKKVERLFIRGRDSRLFLPGYLFAQPFFLRPQLGCKLSAKVFGFKYLANLNFRSAIEGTALDPLDRLFHGFDLPYPESCD